MAYQVKSHPFLLQRALEKGLKVAKGDGTGAARGLLLIPEVEKVLAQFFFVNLVRELAVMFGQLALDGSVFYKWLTV